MDKNKLMMSLKNASKLCMIGLLAYSSVASSTSIPNTSPNPKTFLGPSVRLSVTKGITDITAFSVAGEGGPRNLRLSGTLGWEINYYHRIKTTAELLRQKLTYSFFDGREEPWMNQGALGVDYQYDFRETIPFSAQADLAAYVSHAPSKNLGTSTGTYISNGVVLPYSVNKRIAGSNAAGISPGLTFSPWYGTSATFRVNYDSVRYDNVNASARNAKGFGGTIGLNQLITEDVNLGLSAAIRQPFNNYQAELAWGNLPYYGLWTLKLFSAYTIGKQSSPTTYNVGIGADYLIDADNRPSTYDSTPSQSMVDQPVRPARPNLKGELPARPFKDRGFKDVVVVPPAEWEESDNVNKDLLAWTSVPAVYMPYVMTASDSPVCTPVTFTGHIDDDVGEFYVIQLDQYFVGGSDLEYTVSTNEFQYPDSIIISGNTLTLTNFAYTNIVITARNGCSSASSNAFNYTYD